MLLVRIASAASSAMTAQPLDKVATPLENSMRAI
jgi:hypothetical protein